MPMKTPPPLALATSAAEWAVGFNWEDAALEAAEMTLEMELWTEEALELSEEVFEFWTDEREDINELSEDAATEDSEETEVGLNELFFGQGVTSGKPNLKEDTRMRHT